MLYFDSEKTFGKITTPQTDIKTFFNSKNIPEKFEIVQNSTMKSLAIQRGSPLFLFQKRRFLRETWRILCFKSLRAFVEIPGNSSKIFVEFPGDNFPKPSALFLKMKNLLSYGPSGVVRKV